MAIKFDALEKLLEMDFSQLRALNGRATDEVLILFVDQLNIFFEQFRRKNPTLDEENKFAQIMSNIIIKINEVECNYFLEKNKLNKDGVEIDPMDYAITFKKLPTRMQYWAASEQFGDAIRRPIEHRRLVCFLEQWPNIVKLRNGIKHFFEPKNQIDQINHKTSNKEREQKKSKPEILTDIQIIKKFDF